MSEPELDSAYWRQYYDADEVAEIETALGLSTAVSRGRELRVRHYLHGREAPTVLIAHGLLGYGMAFARFHLPFYRAGYNVIQFDLPGFGASDGPRSGCTVDDFIQAWRDVITYSATLTDGPRFVLGNAEDGVVGYYAAANHPYVNGISVHTLFEYGDPSGVHWVGPGVLVRGLRLLMRGLAAVHPSLGVKATRTIPWPHVFAGPDDRRYRELLERDPLAMQHGSVRLGYSLVRRCPPDVPFEQCRTPVQVVISEASRIWPADTIRRGYARLGGPKQLVLLPGAPHWEANRAFHELYCGYVTRWCAEVMADSQSV